jgi:hypothetical protein
LLNEDIKLTRCNVAANLKYERLNRISKPPCWQICAAPPSRETAWLNHDVFIRLFFSEQSSFQYAEIFSISITNQQKRTISHTSPRCLSDGLQHR